MRLMQRRVEMAKTESKVDRVDVFERRRQEWQVRRQVQERDGENNRAAVRGSWFVIRDSWFVTGAFADLITNIEPATTHSPPAANL
jgi:hypothetical protein